MTTVEDKAAALREAEIIRYTNPRKDTGGEYLCVGYRGERGEPFTVNILDASQHSGASSEGNLVKWWEAGQIKLEILSTFPARSLTEIVGDAIGFMFLDSRGRLQAATLEPGEEDTWYLSNYAVERTLDEIQGEFKPDLSSIILWAEEKNDR